MAPQTSVILRHDPELPLWSALELPLRHGELLTLRPRKAQLLWLVRFRWRWRCTVGRCGVGDIMDPGGLRDNVGASSKQSSAGGMHLRKSCIRLVVRQQVCILLGTTRSTTGTPRQHRKAVDEKQKPDQWYRFGFPFWGPISVLKNGYLRKERARRGPKREPKTVPVSGATNSHHRSGENGTTHHHKEAPLGPR